MTQCRGWRTVNGFSGDTTYEHMNIEQFLIKKKCAFNAKTSTIYVHYFDFAESFSTNEFISLSRSWINDRSIDDSHKNLMVWFILQKSFWYDHRGVNSLIWFRFRLRWMKTTFFMLKIKKKCELEFRAWIGIQFKRIVLWMAIDFWVRKNVC